MGNSATQELAPKYSADLPNPFDSRPDFDTCLVKGHFGALTSQTCGVSLTIRALKSISHHLGRDARL